MAECHAGSSTASSTIIEPSRTDFPFAGWIPTVTGRLSFRHVGEGLLPTEAKYANVATDVQRMVLAYQKRPLSDAKFQYITHNLVTQRYGAFWFAVHATSVDPPGDEDRLVGKIYFYKSRNSWRDHEPPIRERLKKMQRASLGMDAVKSAEATVSYIEAGEALKETADIHVDFVLMRTGDVFFAKPFVRDKNLEAKSVAFAKQWGRDFHKGMADQCYFFLRDIVHKHQHHPAGDDTVLILQERDLEEIKWRKLIIFSLYYFIIGAKRSNGFSHQVRALGILSYCKSFQANCNRRFGGAAEFPIFNNDELRESIDARIREDQKIEETRQYHETRRVLTGGAIRSYSLSGVAIILSLFALFVQPHINDAEKSKYSAVYKFSEVITADAVPLAAGLFIVLLIAWCLTSHRALKNTFGMDVLETGNTNRRKSVPLIILIGVAAVGVTAYFQWALIVHLLSAFWRTISVFL